MALIVREALAADLPAWIALRRKLWPDVDEETLAHEARTMRDWDFPCMPYVAAGPDGRLAGFIEVGMRSLAEGCPLGTTAYVEGIWVEPDFRKSGVGQLLLSTAESWAMANGFSHLGSDARLANAISQAWHQAVGFSEIARLVVYAKRLS